MNTSLTYILAAGVTALIICVLWFFWARSRIQPVERTMSDAFPAGVDGIHRKDAHLRLSRLGPQSPGLKGPTNAELSAAPGDAAKDSARHKGSSLSAVASTGRVWILKEIGTKGEGPSVRLEEEQLQHSYVLGRDASVCDFATQSDAISRRHAELCVRSGQLYLRDLDSTNGTYLDSERLKPRDWTRINGNARLRLGEFPFRIEVAT